jgi:hypothetical protein
MEIGMLPKVMELCEMIARLRMNRNVFTKTVICFLTLWLIEVGCCVVDSCGCDSSAGDTRYKIKSYALKTYSGSTLVAISTQLVKVSDLKIIITPTHEFITTLRPAFKALYACDPAPPAATQKITEFKITSNSDFELGDKSIPAGESLNELFQLDNGPNGSGPLVTYLQNPTVEATIYDYVLTILKPIAKHQGHEFTIDISLTGNQNFSLVTTAVELVP